MHKLQHLLQRLGMQPTVAVVSIIAHEDSFSLDTGDQSFSVKSDRIVEDGRYTITTRTDTETETAALGATQLAVPKPQRPGSRAIGNVIGTATDNPFIYRKLAHKSNQPAQAIVFPRKPFDSTISFNRQQYAALFDAFGVISGQHPDAYASGRFQPLHALHQHQLNNAWLCIAVGIDWRELLPPLADHGIDDGYFDQSLSLHQIRHMNAAEAAIRDMADVEAIYDPSVPPIELQAKQIRDAHIAIIKGRYPLAAPFPAPYSRLDTTTEAQSWEADSLEPTRKVSI